MKFDIESELRRMCSIIELMYFQIYNSSTVKIKTGLFSQIIVINKPICDKQM